jgi:alkanesulfonate monooxygenase SsuD/methylene tetrahydromethanopterin reductase-like flavin-dependent oxidoreductase (luciferase family)
MRFGTYYFLQAPPSITHPDVVRREIEQMVWTEELGFDSIWLTEHHVIDYGLSVSPAVLAAAAAMRTRRVRIGLATAIPPVPRSGSARGGAGDRRHPQRRTAGRRRWTR